MNAEKTDLKVVQIGTGSVVKPTHVRKFTPYGSTKELRSFYIGARLTKAGLPPRNGANYLWEDEASWSVSPWDVSSRGHVAEYNEEREVWASKARARIAELEAALELAEDDLHAIYAGAKPNKPEQK